MKRAPKPSSERVIRYIREEMLDGTTLAAVMTLGGAHKDRNTTLVRWRVWARLRAEGYSYPGIAGRFGVDHTTVVYGLKQHAKGIVPYRNCRCQVLPRSAPRVSHARTRALQDCVISVDNQARSRASLPEIGKPVHGLSVSGHVTERFLKAKMETGV